MEDEEPAVWRQIALKQELGVPGRHRVLHLNFARPAMSGRDHEGPAWKPFSSLNVYLGGSRVAWMTLPGRGEDLDAWWKPFEFPMDWAWPRLSLCLEVVREDFAVNRHTGRVFVFRPEEPHTSGHTAVMGTARVSLMDALVLGDDDDSEVEGKALQKKRQLEEEFNLAKGTQVFQERVKLQRWQLGDAGGEPVNVVCGSVVVILYLSEQEEEEYEEEEEEEDDDDDGPGY